MSANYSPTEVRNAEIDGIRGILYPVKHEQSKNFSLVNQVSALGKRSYRYSLTSILPGSIDEPSNCGGFAGVSFEAPSWFGR